MSQRWPSKKLRRWGYYVLPVMMGKQFVARIDSSMSHGVWTVHKWYWEDGVESTPEVLDALEEVVCRFRCYLGAEALKLPNGMSSQLRGAFKSGFKAPKP